MTLGSEAVKAQRRLRKRMRIVDELLSGQLPVDYPLTNDELEEEDRA
ncbi:MAG: hypothetical protein ACE5JX_18965 [Acidobacteriota bacterium]